MKEALRVKETPFKSRRRRVLKERSLKFINQALETQSLINLRKIARTSTRISENLKRPMTQARRVDHKLLASHQYMI